MSNFFKPTLLDKYHASLYAESISSHTMKGALLQYTKIKLHNYFFEKPFKRVIILGRHDRDSNISTYEKRGKIINEFRPTARIKDGDLILECFPGREYIRHYAAVVATYFQLEEDFKQKKIPVFYQIPSEAEMWDVVRRLNITDIPLSKTVIMGWGLFDMFPDDCWQESEFYVWSEVVIDGEKVTLLGFKNTFWGDIFGRICRVLFLEGGVANILYTAKAGAINRKLVPNESIVTGNQSFVEGEIISWENFFNNMENHSVQTTSHISSPSAIFEINDWLHFFKSFDIVESEIGHGAKEAKILGTQFSYLHFISNTLRSDYAENLSNERNPEILAKREIIKSKLRQILIEAITRRHKTSHLLPSCKS